MPKFINLRPISFHNFSLRNLFVIDWFDFLPLKMEVMRRKKSGTDTHTTHRRTWWLRGLEKTCIWWRKHTHRQKDGYQDSQWKTEIETLRRTSIPSGPIPWKVDYHVVHSDFNLLKTLKSYINDKICCPSCVHMSPSRYPPLNSKTVLTGWLVC